MQIKAQYFYLIPTIGLTAINTLKQTIFFLRINDYVSVCDSFCIFILVVTL